MCDVCDDVRTLYGERHDSVILCMYVLIMVGEWGVDIWTDGHPTRTIGDVYISTRCTTTRDAARSRQEGDHNDGRR